MEHTFEFKCPQCPYTETASHTDLEVRGTPICPKCEIETQIQEPDPLIAFHNIAHLSLDTSEITLRSTPDQRKAMKELITYLITQTIDTIIQKAQIQKDIYQEVYNTADAPKTWNEQSRTFFSAKIEALQDHINPLIKIRNDLKNYEKHNP